MEKGITTKALQLAQTKSFLLSPIFFGSIYIDYDELPEFTKALKFILTQVNGGKPKLPTTFSYSTTNGVVASATYITSGFSKGWDVSLSEVYKYSRATISSSGIILKNKDIDNLIEALEKANKL